MSKPTLTDYLKARAKAQGMNVSALCEKAGVRRQTFYGLDDLPSRMPELQTMVRLAMAVQVHPMQLLQILVDSLNLSWETKTRFVNGDRSAFVRDVSIPDGTIVAPGQVFTKTWESQNVGQVPWIGRVLRCVDEQLVVHRITGERVEIAVPLQPTVRDIAVPDTQPGQTVRMSVDFTAPLIPGAYLSYWKSYFDDGTPCFPDAYGLVCHVQVQSVVSKAFVAGRQG
jgi:hypothetical protein